MDASLSGAAIAKRLASCNKTARNRAVRTLSSWLCLQSDDAVSDADLVKIWKGLFYCVWHADKLPVQAELAGRLASILDSLAAPLAARYFEAFILTIRREWGGIDFLRLDKFYLLVRKFLRHAFLLLKKCSWDPKVAAQLIGILSEKSLLATDKCPANGVNYHIAEVFLDELKEFLPVAVETLDLMLKPFILVLEKSSDKVLVNKIKLNVFDRLIQNGKKLLNIEKAGNEVELGSEAQRLGEVALLLRFSKKLFDSASSSETLQGNRKILFALHEEFLKLENDLEKSGVQISAQHLENGILENAHATMVLESKEQVKLKSECGDGSSNEKQLKKKKSKDGSDVLKQKKSKDGSDILKKKTKKSSKSKKNKTIDSFVGNNIVQSTGEIINDVKDASLNGDVMDTQELVVDDECMISNLQRQFEKAAAEAGMDSDQFSGLLPATPVASAALKKRKRVKSTNARAIVGESLNGERAAGQNGEKSAKKVRFSMKSNLVWKPNNPMPPQSLRLPPSATPKGSALKKGVPPGPIRETPPTVKKIRVKASSIKKSRKGAKSPSAIKRIRKLQIPSV
ncbi:hypothetical protein Cni_G00797 [Canna indica]|uniref:Uncharacterized protein n=1 Tax=Canna indica TaxID=4628 RepID=A0AAQ3JLC9_9LILI|nr:hypothetical protein Cni_G00797 [Canna indica]